MRALNNRRSFLKYGLLFVPTTCGIIRAQQIMPGPIMRTIAAAGGGTCPDDGSPSLESDQGPTELLVCRNADTIYCGQSAWNDAGTSRTICKIGFEVATVTGDISSYTYTAYIYTMSTWNLSTRVATSDGKLGSAISAGWRYWTFPTPYATGGTSTPLAFVLSSSGGVDNTNWIHIMGGDSGVITGYRDVFTSAGGANWGAGTVDCGIRIYWQ